MFDVRTIKLNSKAMVTSKQLEEMLTSFENKVFLKDIEDPTILLQPHLEFKNIQMIDINFLNINKKLHKNICEGILARYGDKLEHLGIKNLRPKNTVLQVPHLSKLKSLAFETVEHDIMNTFVNSVKKENITHLSLCDIIYLDIEQLDDLIFPNLQYLEVGTCRESALSLIKNNKDTITKLKLTRMTRKFRMSDLAEVKINNLSNLEMYNIPVKSALSLIKCNKDTITKLKLSDDYRRSFSNCKDIKIPKLQYLDLVGLPGIDMSLIKNNKDTLCEIKLYCTSFRNSSLPVVEMPRLKRLYTCETSELKFIKFIKAFGGNIEELWYYDKQKETYIRKSREELNNLKKKALASQ